MPNDLLRKGQIRMGETIAILLIFFVLLILAFFFFSSIQAAGTKQAVAVGVQEQGIKVTQIASYLPELQCSTDNALQQFNCIDLEKAIYASEVFEKSRDFYTSAFGFANITLEVLHPPIAPGFVTPAPREINIYDVSKPNYRSAELFPVPVSVFDAKNDTYYFGVLKVIVYG